MSFNISRLRRPDEPLSAGWENTGDGFTSDEMRTPAEVEEGTQDETYDDPQDEDYTCQSEEDEEPYEYESDDELVDTRSQSSGNTETADPQQEEWYKTWLQGFESRSRPELLQNILVPSSTSPETHHHKSDRNLQQTSPDDTSQQLDGEENPTHESSDLNHQLRRRFSYLKWNGSGAHVGTEPMRNDYDGYSGFLISVEEMKGCNTLQCLVPKGNEDENMNEEEQHQENSWKPLPDDETFEITGHHFLSGLSDHMPSVDTDSPTVNPARHGVHIPGAANYNWEPMPLDPDMYCMPFHPTCLEVYKRASLLRFGHVNIADLASWYRFQSDYDTHHNFPRDAAVMEGHQQWWHHEEGTEWLAANPIFMPGLPIVLDASMKSEPSSMQQHDGHNIVEATANTSSTIPTTLTHTHNDPFELLPTEIRHDVLRYLDPKDVSNLRLVSRNFSNLPTSLFRRFMRDEMPWLWEVWTDLPYSRWVTTAKELQDRENEHLQYRKELSRCRQIISEELPELLIDWRDAEPTFESVCSHHLREVPALSLPPDRVDSYRLFSNIREHWSLLKGLQNRRRIWKDCEEILERITAARIDGSIASESDGKNQCAGDE